MDNNGSFMSTLSMTLYQVSSYTLLKRFTCPHVRQAQTELVTLEGESYVTACVVIF